MVSFKNDTTAKKKPSVGSHLIVKHLRLSAQNLRTREKHLYSVGALYSLQSTKDELIQICAHLSRDLRHAE